MAADSKIEWCDHTFNPWIGCTKVSPGCDHCYAEAREDKRLHRVPWGAGQPRQRTKTWGQPVTWHKQHAAFFAEHGRRQRVFCASLADVFDNEVPVEWRDDLWRLIEATPHLDWLLLTKRVGNVQHMVWPKWMQDGFPANVWIGATIVDQAEADRDIPKLLRLPAAVRFLSMEPLLGPVDVTRIVLHSGPIELAETAGPAWQNVKTVNFIIDATQHGKKSGRRALDWVIVGGESGHGARALHSEWACSLRDQCVAAGIPFLFKQWGEWLGALQDGDPTRPVRQINASDVSMRVGKKAAGRLLDGRTHDAFPTPQPTSLGATP